MLRNIIELPDGTRISSGSGADRAIMDCATTGCVNAEKELTIGSACSACVEATIITKDVPLGMTAGQRIKLYKVDEAGKETSAGTFRLEPPTKKSDNVYKITAYDLMVNFDKDMSQWLKEFDDWGCTLGTFADKLCTACGMKLTSMGFPNSNFPVSQFYKSGVTGRKILSWIGEVAGSFCVVDDVNVSFRWYTDSGVTICATGDRYYFAGALTFEDHEVAAIDGVKLRLADSDNGALWPSGDADNPYIITGNHILLARVTESLKPYLAVIQQRLASLPRYKPCKVSLPAGVDIRPGHMVRIEDKHSNQFVTCVMTKTQNGQRDTLECTGSERRDSASAANNKSLAQLAAEQDMNAQSAAQQAVDEQTRQDVFNKLTENGKIQGIYVQDDKWYINAELAQILNLVAELITAGRLKSKDGKTYFDLDDAVFRSESDACITEISGGVTRVYNKSGKLIYSLGSYSNASGNLQLYGENGQEALGFFAVGNRLMMTCYDAETGTVMGGPVGFREINGVKVVALTGT